MYKKYSARTIVLLLLFLTFLIGLLFPHPSFDFDQAESRIFLLLNHDDENNNNETQQASRSARTSCSSTKKPKTELLDGVTIVVTGSTSGIGKSLVKLFLSYGAQVIAIGRSREKLLALELSTSIVTSDNDDDSKATDRIKNNIIPILAEHSDLDKISQAADEIKKKVKRIDYLVNNAGFHYDDCRESYSYLNPTKQGYDMVFGVNYLSHFLLTEKLLPLLQKSKLKSPRIINVSSSTHWSVDGTSLMILNNSNGNNEHSKKRDPLASRFDIRTSVMCSRSYANSKLAQILHMRSLQRRLDKKINNKNKRKNERRIKVISVTPGRVVSNIHSEGIKPFANALGFKPQDVGLASILYAMFESFDEETTPQMQNKNENEILFDYVSSVNESFKNFLLKNFIIPLTSSISSPSSSSDSFDNNFIKLFRDISYKVLNASTLLFQKVLYKVSIQETSPESYNVSIQEDLYEWSFEAVSHWL